MNSYTAGYELGYATALCELLEYISEQSSVEVLDSVSIKTAKGSPR